jgi:subtilisin family serine protease
MTTRSKQALRVVCAFLVAAAVAGCTAGAQTVGLPGSSPGSAALPPHAAGEVLVRVLPTANTAEVASAVGAIVLGEIPQLNVLRLRLPGGGTIADAIRVLEARADVLYAEPNHLVSVPDGFQSTTEPSRATPLLRTGPGPLLAPNDPAFPAKLWGLVKIEAPAAWDVNTGAANVVIAVLDTGVHAAHPDLTGKVLPGANCVIPPCRPGEAGDVHGHGTHVAGTAGALGNNAIGITGVAFSGATLILPVKVLGDDGRGTDAGIAAGIVWAADEITRMGRRGIINMSLGGFGYSQVTQDAVAYATSLAGGSILVVAAMGNEFKRHGIIFPAALTGVMAVGATDGNDRKVSFSSTGLHISVGAPGLDVYSTFPRAPWYVYGSGTSMASPHVAGLAALVWSVFPHFNNYQVRRKIEETAADVGTTGWDEHFGWGRINAARAVVGAAPAPYYGCALITVRVAGAPQPGADVIVTSAANVRRTTKTGPDGVARLDFLPAGTYTTTASRVIGRVGHFGTTTLSVGPTGPTCSPATITMTP